MELKNKALSEQVYIFNTFFYQRLLSKPVKGATSSYNSIKNWTAKVDIFSKKYIIVPIHENLHWYLVVIVNPGLLLQMAETIEQPYILCLDSLGGTHPTVFKVLRSYLQQELLARKGLDLALTTKEIAGKYSSKCPKQENLWDCGVYLLHYAEVFLRNPSGLLDSIQVGAPTITCTPR
ncbi:cysteine proteinase [Linnemannia elongata AG-77]|uniref:Cysteine proteinase n=1 Tax=Linnemannia elongata AG-77 TaxID=1314771 RepID=A0A197JRI9_9FUNG|nr:cysteine proteinase [Linnemannia elongata AG-77]